MHVNKLLLVYRYQSDFVENDYKILKKHFTASAIRVEWSVGEFFKLINAVRKCDLTIAWFANWAAALSLIFAKLFGRKFAVIAGGLDSTWIIKDENIENLEISGVFGKIRLAISKFVFNNADLVLPVSNFAKKGVLIVSKPKKLKKIYNGISPHSVGKIEKEDIVIMVAPLANINIKIKGLKTFAKAAKLLPGIKFIVIGKYEKDSSFYNELLDASGKKLFFTGQLNKQKLYKIMSRARVYCQLSSAETFGYSLAEAMLHKCVPVVTRGTGLQEVAGDIGFYVNYGNEKDTVKKIKMALNAKSIIGENARKRILRNFSINEREQELINAIRTLN